MFPETLIQPVRDQLQKLFDVVLEKLTYDGTAEIGEITQCNTFSLLLDMLAAWQCWTVCWSITTHYSPE